MSKNGAPFHVSVPAAVAMKMKRLAIVAASKGIRASYVASLTAIYERLRNDPFDFGEHCFGKNTLKFSIGAIRPVAVQFAVHEERRIVFVANVILMSS